MKRVVLSLTLTALCTLVPSARNLTLHYNKPAKFFEEALVIGNGKLGATVYGGINQDRLSLNDITLWTGGPDTLAQENHAEDLAAVRNLLNKEDYRGADKANRKMQGHYSENYQPLGSLYINYKNNAVATDYFRQLDINDATAMTRYTINGGTRLSEYFASSPDSVIVVKISDTGRSPLDFTVNFTSPLPHSVSGKQDVMTIDGYAAHHSFPNYYDGLPDSLKHHYDPSRGIRFRTMVKVLSPDCKVVASDKGIRVHGGHEAVLLISNETSFNGFDHDPATDGKDYKAIVNRNIANASIKGSEALRRRHVADYQSLFNRVTLDLGSTDKAISSLPTDLQLLLYTDYKQNNPELEALYFQFGRYLLISSSRTPGVPANLQGLWNEKILPPWSCNYTSNINLQENYWGAETTNLSELHMPMLQFVANLAANGGRTAKNFYGVDRGWCLGHNTDIWAMTNAVGLQDGDPVWASWNMGAAWVATHIWEHYTFTGDKKFLAKYYPYLKGAAEFCIDWLVEKDGYLMTSPGTSPENKFKLPDGKSVATSYGTTADNAMARECLTDAIMAANILNVDKEFVAQASKTIERLAPYKIGAKGSLQEWWHDWEESEPTHRHQTHLFGLYPGHHISPSLTPDLAAACHKTLELRGLDSTGWSTGWRVNLYARLRDRDMAYTIYRRLLRYISPDKYKGPDRRRGGGTYPNLLDAHTPFQIDGNFGGSAGVAEMLLQSTPTDITLLPAIPAQWNNGSVTGLKARGGFTVDIVWEDNQVKEATVTSTTGGKTTLHVNGTEVDVDLLPGNSYKYSR